MAVKTVRYNGKLVKAYPAFNTEAHAHDIEFRYNRLHNEIWEDKYRGKELEEAEKMVDDLGEILSWLDWPVTYLPYNLYQLARETILWADMARH